MSLLKSSNSNSNVEKKVKLFTLAAIILLIAAYFTPIWWVSLTAPNYPKDAFPDGIKIHFYFDGVKNGCKVVQGERSHEIYQGDLGDNPEAERSGPIGKDAGLDCVHEMDTINHYVGMYPIITGAPLEQAFSKYLFAMMIVMLLGFSFNVKKNQVISLGIGFSGVAGWLVYAEIISGGINRFVQGYQYSLGTYFKDLDRITSMSNYLENAAHIVVYVLLSTMVASVVLSLFSKKVTNTYPLLIAFIPFYFVIDFGGWLWFFGHNLHPWGAFTLKPFMPTVFGEGKVAQFSTFSYPHFGFALLFAAMLLLILAFLMRRKSDKE